MSEEACASLALALSGFAVTAATENSGQPVLPRGTRHSRLAAATASAVRPLIEHAKRLVSGITASESADCQQHIEQLETLAFALRSSLGLNGRLPEDEEQQLWQLSVALWVSRQGQQVGAVPWSPRRCRNSAVAGCRTPACTGLNARQKLWRASPRSYLSSSTLSATRVKSVHPSSASLPRLPDLARCLCDSTVC